MSQAKHGTVQGWMGDTASGTLAEPYFGFDFSLVPALFGIKRRSRPLLRAQPTVQRFSKNEGEGSVACPNCSEVEAAKLTVATGSIVEETEPALEASPAPSEPEPAAEETAPEETTAPGLIVEDSVEKLGPGEMRRSEFLAQLRTVVTHAADAALASTGRTTAQCPYLEYWFSYYSRQDSQHLERAIGRYAPETKTATTASEYIPIIAQRVRRSVETWARTGEITGIPEGLSRGMPGMGLLGGLGGLISGIGGIFFKTREGRGRAPDDPRAVQAELGEGRPLEGAMRSRLESAFARDFSHVRTHTDTTAAGLSNRFNARAFTVGKDIAFGKDEYKPGTLVGDALIAHEIAHVIQQSDSNTSAKSPMGLKYAPGSNALEEDADMAALGVITTFWGKAKKSRSTITEKALPHMRSGLRLQRCASSTPRAVSTTAGASAGPPVLTAHRWSVAENPIMIPRDGCRLQLAQDALRPGMKFNGFINAGNGCVGQIYFVQYVNANRVFINCFQERPLGLCLSTSWGIDKAWPYPAGSNYSVSGGEGRAINTEDSPGMRNISNPALQTVRLCFRDEFVTYIVFEDRNARRTPLGWMEWKYQAVAWRDTGNCPLTSALPDCTGWQVRTVEPGRKVAESFVPGNMHRAVPLNRSAPTIDLLSSFQHARDCPATECQGPVSGTSPSGSETKE